jgi:choline dehydrogenase
MADRASRHDYIIVGAGAAGCVLAARLSEDSRARVLLLEAGGEDRAREVHIPAAFSKLFKGPLDWNYSTEPEPHAHNRQLYWPRGKVLGGSTAINAMIYIRGNRLDYDHWKSLGNDGWSYDDVLPYFIKSENQQHGASQFHGSGGPLCVSDLRYVNPLTRAFLGGAQELGIPANPDFNGVVQEGAGLYQVTQRAGQRHSGADAYLKPAMSRANLKASTGAHATRLLLEARRAVGVEYVCNGATETAFADREVILSGGAINSPQLLLLSGIGPAQELEKAGIRAAHDLPGVGKNLQDHPMVSVGYLSKQLVSMASAESLGNIVHYLCFKRGPLTSNVAEAGIFAHTRDGLATPDLQLIFGPAYYVNHGFDTHPEHCFGFGPTLIAPESRGEITLRSQDPLAAPAIRANYLSTENDLRTIVEGVKLCRQIAHTKAFQPHRGDELIPGASVTADADFSEFVRSALQTLYHPVGTCKMGNDKMAVVDSQLRLRGMERLRVVDASIMPRIIAGNTNAPTVMIAEKAADMIRKQA